MLEGMTDEVTPEYSRGLRADVELLRKRGELWRFLERMARQRVASVPLCRVEGEGGETESREDVDREGGRK
jgi:hypothetical protein